MSCPAQYNREVFCARFPEYPVTIPDSPPAEIEILTARNGSPSALFHGKPLHSTRNPEREAERICETLDVPAEAWIILCGFGLGYIALELVHRFPKQRLIILDPDPEPFQGACAVKDISPLLMHPSLTLLIGPDTPPVDAVLADLQYQPVHIVSHKPSRELHPDFYADAEHRIQRLLQRRRVNHNTLKRFGKLWIRNFIANIPRNLQAAALQTAAGKFHGIPGLLVAAGPTFDQSAPYLRDLREHCLIVAVDTALPLCLRNGVDPDIVVVVDPQYWNTRHLDRCGNSRALVVSESSAHPRIFTELHGPFLLGESLFPLGRMLEQHLGTRGKLGAGGSVATSAFEVLRLLGCRKLFTIGLDLGFPESRTHCSGSFFEERIHSISSRTAPAEHHLWRYLTDGGRIPARDYAGRELYTDARMQVYQQWFGMQLETLPEIGLFPLHAGGLAIPGAEPRSHEDVCAMPKRRQEIDSLLAEVRSEIAGCSREPRSLLPHLQKLRGQLLEIDHIASSALQHIEAAWDTPSQWDARWIEKLNACDEHLRTHAAKDIVGFLLQEALDTVQAAGQDEHPLQGSRTIYTALQDSVRFHLSVLGRKLPAADGD